MRFQAGTSAVDHTAARVLGLEPLDVAVLAALWFRGGTVAVDLCVQLDLASAVVTRSLERLVVTGYVAREHGQGETKERYDTTPHARRWIETIWGPLAEAGARVSSVFTNQELATIARFLDRACEAQESHAARLRGLLLVDHVENKRGRSRGGLSPAALRRVELFVEANLGEPLRLSDLAARAGLSEFHFARAFKATANVTPRVYVEQRRIAKAQELIRDNDLSLAQVALAAGFGSQSRMTTTFRKATGVTPAQHREQVSRRNARTRLSVNFRDGSSSR